MKVIFPIDVYQKLRAYVESVKIEISGLGKIRVEGKTIYIEDIVIFKQVCTAGSTIMDKRDVGRFFNDLEDIKGWGHFWWHSHGELACGFSSTDHDTIEEFDNQTQEDNWLLSIVTNRAGEMDLRIDFFAPIRYTIKNIDWEIDFVPKKLENQVFDEVMEKVQIYHSKNTDNPRKERKSTSWSGNPTQARSTFQEHQILLPGTVTLPTGETVAIDPRDMATHPELFRGGIRADAKK